MQRDSKCHVDNTPPEIFHNFSIEPSGTKDKKGLVTLSIILQYGTGCEIIIGKNSSFRIPRFRKSNN